MIYLKMNAKAMQNDSTTAFNSFIEWLTEN